MASNLNQPGESNPYKDFKDYSNTKPLPFQQVPKKKPPRFKQLELDLARIEKKRKSTQRVNEA